MHTHTHKTAFEGYAFCALKKNLTVLEIQSSYIFSFLKGNYFFLLFEDFHFSHAIIFYSHFSTTRAAFIPQILHIHTFLFIIIVAFTLRNPLSARIVIHYTFIVLSFALIYYTHFFENNNEVLTLSLWSLTLIIPTSIWRHSVFKYHLHCFVLFVLLIFFLRITLSAQFFGKEL